MTRIEAEKIVMQEMKPLFEFLRSRCASNEDAEDVTQDVCLKLYRSLLTHDDITEPDKFAWTVTHNTLANYYRNRSRRGIDVPIHGLTDVLSVDNDFTSCFEDSETINRLHREIAYLSKTRRQIVIMHYFEKKRQQEISNMLNLPLGTVKWHLSNAKNELQKGMDKMKPISELTFNPVQFSGVGTNGSAGTMGGNGIYLRSALAQNILFLTRIEAMAINDMANTLNVSPVYIESEVEFLVQNCFMLKRGKGYISNIVINIPTTEHNRLQSEIYEKAADMFAPDLFDALSDHVKIGEGGVICPRNDLNFVMWAIVPYITARSGKPDNTIKFEEAATIRPDGGVNICACSVKNSDAEPMKYSDSMSKMGGPSWNGNEKFLLWLVDTEWGGNRVGNYHPDLLNHDLSSLKTFVEGNLNEDEVLRMAERGYITRKQNSLGVGTIDTLQIVRLNGEANKRLLNIANTIRDKYNSEFNKLKSACISADTPEHLKKASAYGLQHMFLSDGYFIVFVLNKLVESGKLKLPTEEQRNSLGAVIITN